MQLMLESIPQIFFQGYMLKRLSDLHLDKDPEALGINPVAIWISICTALIHVILEIINLYMESKTQHTNLKDYVVACYNAKQGWIAQQTSLISSMGTKDQDQKMQEIKFDDNNEEFCGHGFSVTFEFSDQSLDTLINIISNLPKIDDPARRNTLKLGHCINNISIKKLIELLNLSFKKINIEFIDLVYLRAIFHKDKTDFAK